MILPVFSLAEEIKKSNEVTVSELIGKKISMEQKKLCRYYQYLI